MKQWRVALAVDVDQARAVQAPTVAFVHTRGCLDLAECRFPIGKKRGAFNARVWQSSCCVNFFDDQPSARLERADHSCCEQRCLATLWHDWVDRRRQESTMMLVAGRQRGGSLCSGRSGYAWRPTPGLSTSDHPASAALS
jgi:hypothetical protein